MRTLKKALLADADPERSATLNQILTADFAYDVTQVTSYDELCDVAVEGNWAVILIDVYLPRSSNSLNFYTFRELQQQFDLLSVIPTYVLFRDENSEERSSFLLSGVEVLPIPPLQLKSEQHQQLLEKLNERGLKTAPRLPDLNWEREPGSLLTSQISTLSPNGDLVEGEGVLKELIAKSLDCEQASVQLLSQGRSGASVFRVIKREEEKSIQFLFKLVNASSAGSRLSMRKEIEGHKLAMDKLGGQYGFDFARHFAHLQKPLRPSYPGDKTEEYIVTSGQWDAIHFEFIGNDELGEFIDLEEALLLTIGKWPEGAQARHSTAFSRRERPIESILEMLCAYLYRNKKHTNRVPCVLWNFDSQAIHQEKYKAKPPYRLTPNTRKEILQFLKNNETLSEDRFFLPDWEWKSLKQKVRHFVEGRPDAVPALLQKKCHVLLSLTHGDMNSNNALFWLERWHPFLIDFSFFQEQGHALQDLARLEAEIKFALMDRPADDDTEEPQNTGHAYWQRELWRCCEHFLLDSQWGKEKTLPKLKSPSYDNVRHCYRLILMIREQAKKVQEQKSEVPDCPTFEAEYFPALLYHTLRAISYDSLPRHKRLLAVYSASKLIDRIGQIEK